MFDPFDLTDIEVRWQGRAMGAAVPHRIGRHVHHKARPDEATPRPRRRPGSTTCAWSRPSTPPNWPNELRYRDLPDGHVPGQLILPGTGTGTDAPDDGSDEASV